MFRETINMLNMQRMSLFPHSKTMPAIGLVSLLTTAIGLPSSVASVSVASP
jgi:hypothetical protein